MSVATKIAAFAVIIRLFDVALLPAVDDWRPVWIAIAVISILVGNVGALGQSSLKRMLAYSSIAQAGYVLAGCRRRDAARHPGGALLPRRLPVREHGRVRGRDAARARDRRGRRPRVDARPRRPAPARGARDDAGDAEPRRHPGDGRLHGQVPADRGDRRRRLHLARHRDRDRVDDLARVLPAGGRDDVARRGAAGAGRARHRSRDRPRGARRRGAGRRRAASPGAGGWETQLVALVMGGAILVLRHRPAAALRPRAARRGRHPRAASSPRRRHRADFPPCASPPRPTTPSVPPPSSPPPRAPGRSRASGSRPPRTSR